MESSSRGTGGCHCGGAGLLGVGGWPGGWVGDDWMAKGFFAAARQVAGGGGCRRSASTTPPPGKAGVAANGLKPADSGREGAS